MHQGADGFSPATPSRLGFCLILRHVGQYLLQWFQPRQVSFVQWRRVDIIPILLSNVGRLSKPFYYIPFPLVRNPSRSKGQVGAPGLAGFETWVGSGRPALAQVWKAPDLGHSHEDKFQTDPLPDDGSS